jgi:hypothetical protein
MLRILLFSSLMLATPLMAQVDSKIHNLCIQAKDYAGCVKAMTTAPVAEEDKLTPLRNAMKQVAARLAAGTSLRDSTETFRPVVDQLAVVSAEYPEALAVKKAKLSSQMFDALQFAWDTRIKAYNYALNQYGGTPVYNCKALKQTVDTYNSIPGAPFIDWRYSGGVINIGICRVESESQLPESFMRTNIIKVLEDGSISPAEIAERERLEKEREAKAAREKELCAMGPWNRYLEENPNIGKWAAANPEAAESQKKKFLADPKNQNECKPKIEWSKKTLEMENYWLKK